MKIKLFKRAAISTVGLPVHIHKYLKYQKKPHGQKINSADNG
ncbi:MAG: hypothetical protein OFPI_04870 [Osedax symbiont Rs2]|nr:MAG: hypothetical protein OFPI_04870 [Osedax symbiont Rs2]